MRDIRELEIPDHFRRSNFGYIEIIEKNANGMKIDKSYYKISRDGYNLLIMGYRGKNSMSHKLAFIEAFNILEAEVQRLRLEGPAPQPQIEAPGYLCGHCRQVLPSSLFNLDRRETHRGKAGAGNAMLKAVFGKRWSQTTFSGSRLLLFKGDSEPGYTRTFLGAQFCLPGNH